MSDQHERLTRQWWSMYMRGWDDALGGRRMNPYSRVDFRNAWGYGYRDCMANKPLPGWYDEWKEGKKAQAVKK